MITGVFKERVTLLGSITKLLAGGKMAKKNLLFCGLLGLSVGWMVGLSVSDVINAVISTLLGLLGGGSAVLGLIKPKTEQEVTFMAISQLAIISLFIAIGATAGIMVRTHHILEPSPDVIVKKYVESGIASKEIYRSIIENRYGLTDKSKNAGNRQNSGVLFSGESGEDITICDIANASESRLPSLINSLELKELFKPIVKKCGVTCFQDALKEVGSCK